SFPAVTTTPLMAASVATLSTSAPSSSITLELMTFIERPGISQVTSAIPSASTSVLKFAIAGSSPHFGIALVRLAVLPGVPSTFFVGYDHHVDIGIMCALRCGARPDLDEDRIAVRAINQTVAIRHAGLPGRCLARLEHGLPAVFAQHHFALK